MRFNTEAGLLTILRSPSELIQPLGEWKSISRLYLPHNRAMSFLIYHIINSAKILKTWTSIKENDLVLPWNIRL